MKDYLIRATAANGQVRAFGVTSRELTETAKNAHDTSPVATAALGRLMSAAVMMGADLKGENDLLTLRMEGDGPMGGLLATADSHGNVKGYAFHPEVLLPPNAKGKLDVGGALGAGMLSVVKDIGLKEPYVGQTNLVSGEIAEDLTYYYAASEQIPCSIALGVLMNKDNTVRQAGGFMIQLLPGGLGRADRPAGGAAWRASVDHRSFRRGKNAGRDPFRSFGGFRSGDLGEKAGSVPLRLQQGAGGAGHREHRKKRNPGNDRGRKAH